MEKGEREKEEESEASSGRVWLLVDHSSREAALMPVARKLEERGISVELVTITEVIGSVAREALAGGAERILRGLRVAMRGRAGDEDLVGAFRRRRPDVLVVTEPRYARSIGVLENLTGVESLQVGLVPDFSVDPGWFNGQLHAFIVPDEATKEDVLREGYKSERVQVAGPALRPSFRRTIDKEKVRKELGLDDTRVVLVRGDGINTEMLEKLVFQCTLCDRDVRFIFHHDGDGATSSSLRRAADQYGLSAAMFGRVSDLERYFAAADAIVAADGDAYLAEILESKTPLLFVPSGRAPRGNGDALSAMGVADNLEDMGQLGTRLDRFLEPERLDEIGEKLADWDGTEKADRLVDALETIVDHADEWRLDGRREVERPEKEADREEQTDEEKSEPAVAGPFETIGTREKSKPGAREEDGPDRSRDYSRLSRAEAKEQLAQLILKEREHERRLAELDKQQERWRGRLQLAREWNEEDLAEEAENILRGYIEEVEPLEAELNDIRRQKEKLKSAARGGQGEGDGPPQDFDGSDGRGNRIEERFQKMEVDRDLEGLRDRIKRELGE